MKKPCALIGFSGFVGATLLNQRKFERCFRSTTIGEMDGGDFDLVVCAAPSAQKWIANHEPEADRRKVESLIGHLKTIQCNTFVLISTVDVFKRPLAVNEDSLVDEEGLHPYGLHRRGIEKFVAGRFPKHLIVRLSGLVGPGLRKNVIFDFLNNHNLHMIDSRGVFQFYPMVNLWRDIQIALQAGLNLVHLTAEPVSVAEIALAGFDKQFDQTLPVPAPAYDLQSKYAGLFGGEGVYQYSKRETIQTVQAYAQSEPVTIKPESKKHG